MLKISYLDKIRIQELIDEIKRRLGNKADSTFTGTQEEWDALPIEEKAKYPTTYIINNYDSGGGSGGGSTDPEDEFKFYVDIAEPKLKAEIVRYAFMESAEELYAIYSDNTKKKVSLIGYGTSTSSITGTPSKGDYFVQSPSSSMAPYQLLQYNGSSFVTIANSYNNQESIGLVFDDDYGIGNYWVSTADGTNVDALYLRKGANDWELVTEYTIGSPSSAPTGSGELLLSVSSRTLMEDNAVKMAWYPKAYYAPGPDYKQLYLYNTAPPADPKLVEDDDEEKDCNWYWAQIDNLDNNNIIALYRYNTKTGWNLQLNATGGKTYNSYSTSAPSDVNKPLQEYKTYTTGSYWLVVDNNNIPQKLYRVVSSSGLRNQVTFIGYGSDLPATGSSSQIFIKKSSSGVWIIYQYTDGEWTIISRPDHTYPPITKLATSTSKPPTLIPLGSNNIHNWYVVDNLSDRNATALYNYDTINAKWVLTCQFKGGRDFELGTGLKWDDDGKLAIDFEPVVNIEHAIVLNKEEATDP